MSLRLLLCVLAIVQSAAGQTPPGQVRDGREAANQIGTARLTGRVLSDTSPPTPVRRAIVTLRGAAIPAGRSTITDDDGRFVIDQLPEGRVIVTATKPAWLTGAYGARVPGRPGTPLAIGTAPIDITLQMARGVAIAGVIRDQRGVPAEGVQVTALNMRALSSGLPVDADRGAVVTDDRGAYRIFGLMPGDYVVMASKRLPGTGEIAMRPDDDIDQLLGEARRGGPATLPGQGPARPAD